MKGYIICETGNLENKAEIVKEIGPEKRVLIKATLQEADVKNRNERIYPKSVLAEGLSSEYVTERIKTGTFFGKRLALHGGNIMSKSL